jgi:hypothetical protein
MPDAIGAIDGVNHRMVETNGIRMHVAEAGDGPLVLLLHGFPEGLPLIPTCGGSFFELNFFRTQVYCAMT